MLLTAVCLLLPQLHQNQVNTITVTPSVTKVMQEHAPAEERGRVFSFQSMLYNAGSIPVLLFADVIGDTLGIETVMYILAAAMLGFSWWAARYSHRSVAS